jgi:hypothetical protein
MLVYRKVARKALSKVVWKDWQKVEELGSKMVARMVVQLV